MRRKAYEGHAIWGGKGVGMSSRDDDGGGSGT